MALDLEWLSAWSKCYSGTDQELDGLAGKPFLDLAEAASVVGWKLRRVWQRKHLDEFNRNTDEQVRDITRRAFSSPDDLCAVMALTALAGVSVPTASALLVAHDPERFTIADARAWESLTTHGYLGDLQHTPWSRCWTAYLETCRRVKPVGMSLRDVDRALWAAAGDTSLPK